MNFISGTVNVIVHYLLIGEKSHPRSGAFAGIFHVGNYGSWKKNKSQNNLTFILYMKLTLTSILNLCMPFFELTWFYLNLTPN